MKTDKKNENKNNANGQKSDKGSNFVDEDKSGNKNEGDDDQNGNKKTSVIRTGTPTRFQRVKPVSIPKDMDNSFNHDDEYAKKANDELKKVKGKEFTKKKNKKKKNTFVGSGRISLEPASTKIY